MQGQILRIDLTTGHISKTPISDGLRRKFLGGVGINARLLWEHFLTVDPHVDALSPDNVLIVGMGPLLGTGFGAGSKMQFTFKSPAYNLYGDSACSGALGAQLRWAGYDHVVITGKAAHPVYVWINDDDVRIRDARHVWGKNTHETEAILKEELADRDVEIACIGQAGENLVRVASIIARGHRAAARGGGGCVFGSKNLKAIVGRGTHGIAIHDRDAFLNVTDEFLAAKKKEPDIEQFMRFGTLAVTRMSHGMGFNTYRNFQGRELPDEAYDKLDHNWYTENIGVRAWSCSPGCFLSCSGWNHIKGHESPAAKAYAGEWGTKPEYGASNPFGASCDVRDMPAVVHFTTMCNRYGIDTMEIGMGISFLMELWERGIITEADTAAWSGDAVALRWGDYEVIDRLIEAAALKKNMLGEILHGGVYHAAQTVGRLRGIDVLKYAAYGKGGATHEGPVRSWANLGLACAVCAKGAHHCAGVGLSPLASVDYFGKANAGQPFEFAFTGAGQALSENLLAITHSLGICNFLSDPIRNMRKAVVQQLSDALWAVTGLRLTPEELALVGDRVTNIEKAFNSRLGLRREHDTLCERWLNEPQLEGLAAGMKGANYLEAAKDEYYQWRGWDTQTALQTRRKLEELDLPDVADVLQRENAVSQLEPAPSATPGATAGRSAPTRPEHEPLHD